MEQMHASIVRFSEERDVHQTADLLRRCVDENLRNPEQQHVSREVVRDQPAGDKVCALPELSFLFRAAISRVFQVRVVSVLLIFFWRTKADSKALQRANQTEFSNLSTDLESLCEDFFP